MGADHLSPAADLCGLCRPIPFRQRGYASAGRPEVCAAGQELGDRRPSDVHQLSRTAGPAQAVSVGLGNRA